MDTADAVTFSRNNPTENEDHNTISEKNKFLSEAELSSHIRGCVANDRVSQKEIYVSFYGYAMSICDRYSNNHDDSLEILNDGFLKIFKEIHRYKPAYTDTASSFKGWLRKIMIYTAIDHYRKNRKQRLTTNIEDKILHLPVMEADILDQISYDEIRDTIQQLTPSYRLAFNLFVMEGYTHEEIAKRLGITVGASKSNLARGRKQMQKLLLRLRHIKLHEQINE